MMTTRGADLTRPMEVRAVASTLDVDRWARLPRHVGAPSDSPRRLGALRLAVVGAGAVGARIVDNVARLGVSAMTIVDHGRFKPESVLTQPVTPEAIGHSKARHAARLVTRIAPATRVHIFDGPVQALDADVFHDADAVFLATDNLAAEIDVGQRCARLGRPLIQASVHGETLTAQVRVFANRPADACLACDFTAEEWAHVGRGTRFACDPVAAAHAHTPEVPTETGDLRAASDDDVPVPTASIGALCSMASDLAVVQLVRRTLGLGDDVDNSLVTYSGYTHTSTITALAPNAGCPCDHRSLTVVAAPTRLGALSLAALRRLAENGAGGTCGLTATSYAVGAMPFIARARCACGAHSTPQRFVAFGDVAASCTVCGEPVHAEPYHAHTPVPRAVVAPVVDTPLEAITSRRPRLVTVWGDVLGVLFREEDYA